MTIGLDTDFHVLWTGPLYFGECRLGEFASMPLERKTNNSGSPYILAISGAMRQPKNIALENDWQIEDNVFL